MNPQTGCIAEGSVDSDPISFTSIETGTRAPSCHRLLNSLMVAGGDEDKDRPEAKSDDTAGGELTLVRMDCGDGGSGLNPSVRVMRGSSMYSRKGAFSGELGVGEWRLKVSTNSRGTPCKSTMECGNISAVCAVCWSWSWYSFN